MIWVVVVFFWLSILLYFLLGGADFGAGIIELFTSERRISRTRRTLYHAIGPIWEANHMWLVIAIVILFVGFPTIYALLSVHLHIPLLLMLLGIIARGTAFVFRHYDAVLDSMQDYYNRTFVWSSFITPFFLGIIAGSTLSGKIDPAADQFLTAFVFPWFNFFSIAVGFFTIALCGFLAAVYLIGEAQSDADRQRFVKKARNANMVAFLLGGVVFVAAAIEDVPLVRWMLDDSVGLMAIAGAAVSMIALWLAIKKRSDWAARALVAFQVSMILLAVSYEHFPDIVLLASGDHLSLLEERAPQKTIDALGWALLLGSVFILPALFYLYYSFQKKPKTEGA